MTTHAQELLRAALALPVSDRADVAAELLASLDESAETDRQAVEAAWAREIEHRARRVIQRRVCWRALGRRPCPPHDERLTGR